MYRKPDLFRYLWIIGLVLALSGVLFSTAAAQRPSQIRVYCSNGRVEVEFTEWLPEEALTAYVDGAEVGQYTTNTSGGGRYQFPYGAQNVALARANGDTIIAGAADCSQPPPGEISDVSQYQVTVPVGGQVELSATGQDADGNEIPLSVLWVAESGSFTPEGEYTGTEEGNYILSANLIGDRSSFAYQINAIVTPPLVSLSIDPGEITVFANQGIALNVVALDGGGNPVEVFPAWDTGGGGEVVPENFFVAGMETGDYTVTATIPGTDLSASVLVHVIPMLERIQIVPEMDELTVGDTQQFDVLGFDPDGNQTEVPVQPSWTAELGIIDASGAYAATTAGEEVVTAVVDLNALMGASGGIGMLAGQIPNPTNNLTFTVREKAAVPEEIATEEITTEERDSEESTTTGEEDVETESQSTEPDELVTEAVPSTDEGGCWWCRLTFWVRLLFYVVFFGLLIFLLFCLPKWKGLRIPWWVDVSCRCRVIIFCVFAIIVIALSYWVCW